MPSIEETSKTLLKRLEQQDPRAWEDFATKYVWMMRRWLRLWKIPGKDVDDVVQDACLRVFRSIHTFEHRGHGSFRAWLKKVSRSCWLQIIRRAATSPGFECSVSCLSKLMSEETFHAIDSQVDVFIEHELFDYAITRTRGSLNDRSWEAFRLTVLEGRSGAVASKLLGIPVNSVYKNKERFQAGLFQELRTLHDAPGNMD